MSAPLISFGPVFVGKYLISWAFGPISKLKPRRWPDPAHTKSRGFVETRERQHASR